MDEELRQLIDADFEDLDDALNGGDAIMVARRMVDIYRRMVELSITDRGAVMKRLDNKINEYDN